MKWPFTLVIPLFLSLSAVSQEYSYKHYDIADGLASSTVYCIAQDKDGYIWVGTEAGVCRLDGTHITTYTVADGLPDLEVLQLFADSKGRIWMAPFRGSVCYYFQGKIHNQQNEPVLSMIHLKEEVEDFAEDAQGNILIQQKSGLVLLGKDDRIVRYDSAGGEPIRNSISASRNLAGNFNVQIGTMIYALSDKGFSLVRSVKFVYNNPAYIAISPSWGVWRESFEEDKISSFRDTGRSATYPFGYPQNPHVSFSFVDDSLLFINKYDGVVEFNLSNLSVMRRLLPGKKVSRTFRDRAGSLWFTTIGNGLYRLYSDAFMTIHLPENGIGVSSVHSINLNLAGDQLMIGDNHNVIFPFTYPGLRLLMSRPVDEYGVNRILFVQQFGYKKFVYGEDGGSYIGDIETKAHRPITEGIKSACAVDDHRVLLGGFWGAAILDVNKGQLTDTLWHGRITALFSKNDTNYIGTLHGLWQVAGKTPARFMGAAQPFLRNRISAMAESADGTLWVASYEDSIIGYCGNRIVATITSRQGLVGSVCHCLYLHDNALWVGTDKGLNKIELDKPGYPVVSFSSRDGLASDQVNTVFGVGTTIFAGTSAGLSYFDQTKVRTGDECSLDLTAAINGGRNRMNDNAALELPVGKTDIRFEFVGISYRSEGQIRYLYRLVGLDSAWKETPDNYLAYPTLPGGHYEFEVLAINRFGAPSGMSRVAFVVARPFWNRIWFYVLEFALLIAGVWLFVNWRVRRVRRQQEERSRQSRRMMELEHTALQAQMNPHFIFNCLNSIQQFVFDKDMLATNEYISNFARLVRATLNHSSQPFITVAEEVEYLTNYLSLEKMRFKNKMDYSIEVAPGIDAGRMMLPPILLQPYVENCVRHGLRHKANGQGYVRILFRSQAGKLIVTIRDNGIGREKATEFKTGEHIEYQSKGMSLTSSRIRMINLLYKSRIEVTVEDVVDEGGQSDGTRVTMELPIFQ